MALARPDREEPGYYPEPGSERPLLRWYYNSQYDLNKRAGPTLLYFFCYSTVAEYTPGSIREHFPSER